MVCQLFFNFNLMEKYMKKILFWLVAGSFLWLFQSCVQPSELDEPTKVSTNDRAKMRIYPNIYYVSLAENGVEDLEYSQLEEKFSCNKIEIFVDTLYPTPLIWFKIYLEKKKFEYNNREFSRLKIKSLNFNIDSFPILGIPLLLKKSNSPNSWVKVNLARGPKNTFDTIIDPSAEPNYFEIGFTYNKPYREIWANGYGKIYSQRFSLVQRDTIVVDSVLKTRFDTVWVDNKPQIKKVEYWEVKEIRLKIDEITKHPDSLILNFKFRLKY